MRRGGWTAALATACALAWAPPAAAIDVAPIDNPRWGFAYDVGATTLGGQLALGPLRMGAAGYYTAVPGLDRVAGFSTTVAWRCSPHEWGSLAWGVGVTNYMVAGLAGSAAPEGYGVYPALVGTVPLFGDLVLRASAGPLLFSGTTGWEWLDDGRRVRRGAYGVLPLAPNVQVAWKMDDGSEITFGGYPSIMGYRLAI